MIIFLSIVLAIVTSCYTIALSRLNNARVNMHRTLAIHRLTMPVETYIDLKQEIDDI